MYCTIDLRSDDTEIPTNILQRQPSHARHAHAPAPSIMLASVPRSPCPCKREGSRSCLPLTSMRRGSPFLSQQQVMESSAVPECPYLIHTFRDSMRFVTAELEWKKEFTSADPLRCRFTCASIFWRVELNSSTQLRDWATGQIILSCPSPCF